MKKSKRSPILEELLNDSPKDIEERVKKLSKMILGEYDENNLIKVYNKMNKEEQYTITLSKSQLELLKVAIDKYGRLIIGQLNNGLWDILRDAISRHETDQGELYRSEIVEQALNLIKKTAWNHSPNQSYGVAYSETSDTLFDMKDVIRHKLWKDAGESTQHTVDAYPPHHWNKKVPLIKVEKAPAICKACQKDLLKNMMYQVEENTIDICLN